MSGDRTEHLVRFYSLLSRLEASAGGPRTLLESSGRMDWPRWGIYFFREPGEARTDTGHGPRVVRIGTHALKAGARTTLWTRLAQHKGHARSGGGNHRGSIFRLIVGNALINKHSYEYPSWGQGGSASTEVRRGEQPLEIAVSGKIGQMPFLWMAVEDAPGPDSKRGYLERNAIALLSNYDKAPLDPPSPGWLGRHSDREKIQRSGLWNSNHVDEAYDPAFLDEMEGLVARSGRAP